MERSGRRLPCLIEVNTGEEPQKSGVLPADADGFIVECRDRLGLPIRGLMCVPPLDEEPALHFALLREIARRTGLGLLSMGMSADFEKAIRLAPPMCASAPPSSAPPARADRNGPRLPSDPDLNHNDEWQDDPDGNTLQSSTCARKGFPELGAAAMIG